MINSKKKNVYSNTLEYQFFAENSRILSKLEHVYKLRSYDEKTFKIIQANILIRALLNKNFIESKVEDKDMSKPELESLLKANKCPKFTIDGCEIYVPIYSKGLNFIYVDEPNKLKEYPYDELKEDIASSCIDLFDEYNINLYESNFTNLIKLGEDKTSAAFYHKEFETIYIINDQGRLDLSIRLFDKYLDSHDYTNLEERLINVIKCFFNKDRHAFINSLYSNKFISQTTYKMLLSKSLKNISKNKVKKGVAYEIL
jgi:hypothetical protein